MVGDMLVYCDNTVQNSFPVKHPDAQLSSDITGSNGSSFSVEARAG